jgi:hypothetical protein
MIFAIQMTTTEQIMILGQKVMERSFEIVKAPLSESTMLWILGPMVIALLLMSFYFGRYKSEELGWNTAFGNSLILIFASVDLLRYLFNHGGLFSFSIQNALVFAVIAQGILLTFLNFFHLLPKSFAFGMSSGMTVNIVVLFVIILIYSQLPLDYITAIACAILSAVIIGIISIIQLLQPTVIEEE